MAVRDPRRAAIAGATPAQIWASMLKDAIKRRQPGFNESYYGFAAFGNLLDEAQARGLLEVGRDDEIRHLRRDPRRPAKRRAGGHRAGCHRRAGLSRTPAEAVARRGNGPVGARPPRPRNLLPRSPPSRSVEASRRPSLDRAEARVEPTKMTGAAEAASPPASRRRRLPTIGRARCRAGVWRRPARHSGVRPLAAARPEAADKLEAAEVLVWRLRGRRRCAQKPAAGATEQDREKTAL